jgi:hypothetical protein
VLNEVWIRRETTKLLDMPSGGFKKFADKAFAEGNDAQLDYPDMIVPYIKHLEKELERKARVLAGSLRHLRLSKGENMKENTENPPYVTVTDVSGAFHIAHMEWSGREDTYIVVSSVRAKDYWDIKRAEAEAQKIAEKEGLEYR